MATQITVLYSEYAGQQRWSPVIGGFTINKTFSVIPGASFVTGHRYLLICKALTANEWPPTRTWVEVHQGGVAISKLGSGNWYTTVKGLRFSNRPHDGFAIITGDSTKDVEYIGRWEGTGGTYDSRMAETQMLAIDLDTTGATLIENSDWFHTENATNHVPGSNSYVSTEAASLTFTPDGVSDYLVLGDIKIEGPTNSTSGMRLYDVTDAASLGVAAFGTHGLTKNMLMSVLEAPPAATRTIRTDYYASLATKENAQVFALRLNAFKSYGFSQRDLGGINQTALGVYQDAALPISYTPDATGDVVLLASARGYIPINTEDGYGLNGRILYDGVPLTIPEWYTPGQANISQGPGTLSDPAMNGVGATFAMLLTGKSGAVDIKTEIRADNAWAVTHNRIYFYNQTLIAFGTELVPTFEVVESDLNVTVAETKSINSTLSLGSIAEAASVDAGMSVTTFGTSELNPDLEILVALTSSGVKGRNTVESPSIDFESRGVVKGDSLYIKTGPNAGSYVIRGVDANALILEQSLPSEDPGPIEADIRKNRDIVAYRSAAVVVSQPAFNPSVGMYAVLDMMVV